HYIFNFSATDSFLFFKTPLQYSLYLFDILFLIIFSGWTTQKIKTKPTPKTLKSNWLLFLAIYLLGNSLFLASNLNASLYNSLRLLEILVFFSIFIDIIKTRKLFNKVLYLIFLSGVIQSIIALSQFIFQKSLNLKYLGESILSPNILGVAKLELQSEKFIRAYGTFPHPNLLGAFLFLALIAGLYFALNKNWKIPFSLPLIFKKFKLSPDSKLLSGQIHFGAGLLLILIGILVTFSRSIWLTTSLFGLILIFRFFLQKNHRINTMIKSMILFSLILMILFFSFSKFIPTRLCLRDCQDQSLTLRQNCSQFSQSIIKNNFFFGIGPGQFILEFKKLNPQNLPTWDLQPVHNLYLLAWSEIGLIGFVLLILFIFKNFQSIKLSRKNELFLILTGSFLLLGFFDHYFWTLPQGQFIFWLALALLITSGKIRK
ncbi:MAG: O-antigen ligase family protein, partial [Candidatus Moranbacteria bacterium]|nr:O-antigen ligase family protein [Candidatus Moranbacteria bacterium]